MIIGVVDTAEWRSSPEDIRQVCVSVAHCFDDAIAERVVEPIRIEPSFFEPSRPRALFARAETGHVRVTLSARGTDWAKFSYQFAHEFLHVLANIRAPIVQPTDWIEESLCEAASLFALRAMGRTWEVNPPYRNWRDYSAHLPAYATRQMADAMRTLSDGVTFGEWFESALPALELNRYDRERNDVVAGHLLPLFEEDPATWRVVRYLNTWSTLADVTFPQYFDTWRSVTPPEHHRFIDRIERMFREPLRNV